MYVFNQPKPVKFTNCGQCLSHIFFGLDVHLLFLFLYVFVLVNQIMMSKKFAFKIFNSVSLTESTTEFEYELNNCDEVYLYIPNFLQD